MSGPMLSNSPIVNQYVDRTPASQALAAQAGKHFPSAITHDSRHTTPYGIYVEKAKGSRKWDADGNNYVDYFGGHGALMLGHRNEEVEVCIQEALAAGTHFGSSHKYEVAWAGAVQNLMPSAERIRFTASGTEATLLAMRLARAFTGKNRIARFRTHFHGWHDHMAFGVANHFDGTATPGVLPEVAAQVTLLDPNDIDAVAQALEDDKEIAAIILEPTGGGGGMVPLVPDFVVQLRELTERHGVLLILDEVVTGFRVHPGGAQGLFGVTPDLSTLAKILAGGLPGGAVVGRQDILERLDFKSAADKAFEKIHHPGTFNANPLSAAAGTKTLEIIANTDACAKAAAFGAEVRQKLNESFARAGIAWAAYGEQANFFIFMNSADLKIDPLEFDPLSMPYEDLKGKPAGLLNKLRLALLIGGVDISGSGGGVISATHDDDDLAQTVAAFEGALEMLRAEESLPKL
ncbi:MAG: aminotransferase class III-fold pyridoxal phosphate-dependent enzyme [Rhodospirillaceae bacterium]|nr:aminotransferase class III-fold pyridoxal phosphate-dependent enzyme [Rhodospirillaceae bacterium]MBT4687157.1 aminotransferase class III-fold pyridoxal phosphate-dependent enzyme [Rhodospirillaceae bacterium]MBT5081347.1 aminotransferase class III-fold pyridoxal phosphate-dependent enzyme [Rhodospirillaceae bacterium]MBT5522831.1 aminotransferase class III-fold pyridoxal phosphate-dependent enzyme [Rhodospirillaceae bacterium]MBT5880934.1 aminotransferase class III-fold pyridoxal phosphate-